MEVPLLGIREIGENPGEVSDYVPATTSGLNVLTIHRPPRKSQVFDKMETTGTEITYRCKDCRHWPECKKSDRFESISIQEEIEQTVIERSVNVDISIGRTIAKLPFLCNPVHQLRPNTGMALRVYQSLVRKLGKSPGDVDRVIQSERKLHDLGFVQFVDDLNIKDRDMIHESQVKYFIPCHAVWNENSYSTPCRFVFDAS